MILVKVMSAKQFYESLSLTARISVKIIDEPYIYKCGIISEDFEILGRVQ